MSIHFRQVFICLPILLLCFACKFNRSDSELKVVQGTSGNSDSAVVLLGVDADKDRVCTGVPVSPSTVLMAGHCVKDPTLETGVSYYDSQRDETFKSKRLYTWMALSNREQLSEALAARDIAVVFFEDRPFTNTKSIARAGGTPGQAIKLVGYGVTDFNGGSANASADPKQSQGSNAIQSVSQNNEGLIWIEATNDKAKQNNSIAGNGDSGGPLLDRSGQQVIGIAAGLYFTEAPSTGANRSAQTSSLNSQNWKVAVNTYANLNSPSARSLLQFAVNDLAEIPGYTKGAPTTFNKNDETFMQPRPDLGALSAELTKDKFIALCGSGGGGGGKFNGGGAPGGGTPGGGIPGGGIPDGSTPGGALPGAGDTGRPDAGNPDPSTRGGDTGRPDAGTSPRSDDTGAQDDAGQNGSPVSFRGTCDGCHTAGGSASPTPSKSTWQGWVNDGSTPIPQMQGVFNGLTKAQREAITATMP